MSDSESKPTPSSNKINPATTILGGVLLLPLMVLSAWILVEEYSDGLGFGGTMCIIQIIGLGVLWWRIGKEHRWMIVLLYLVLAAAFYLLMIGICASGDYR